MTSHSNRMANPALEALAQRLNCPPHALTPLGELPADTLRQLDTWLGESQRAYHRELEQALRQVLPGPLHRLIPGLLAPSP